MASQLASQRRGAGIAPQQEHQQVVQQRRPVPGWLTDCLVDDALLPYPGYSGRPDTSSQDSLVEPICKECVGPTTAVW